MMSCFFKPLKGYHTRKRLHSAFPGTLGIDVSAPVLHKLEPGAEDKSLLLNYKLWSIDLHFPGSGL